MSRIATKFEELEGKKAFVGYITAGYPTLDSLEELVKKLEKSGVDIIEIGIPYSDPLADGEIIQKAGLRALEQGVTVEKIFESIKRIREWSDIPLVFLTYFNTVLRYDIKRFVKQCEEVGMDGIIIPDLPLEEREEVLQYTRGSGVDLIPLVAPTSKDRISQIVKDSTGFVYCVSSLGVTGMRNSYDKDIEDFIKEVKSVSKIPVLVGFGISNRDSVRRFNQICDGVIVGSYIIDQIIKDEVSLKYVEEGIRAISTG